jgi:hypothetical protein
VTHIEGWSDDGRRVAVRLTPAGSPAANYAFDVTPARLVTALIAERGVCSASREGLLGLFPEHATPAPAASEGSVIVNPSCPALCRASTQMAPSPPRSVDGRIKSGHDG